ncbi:MAG TPA: endonuclease/exonuclease/phosphatase family protein [Gemmatimonadales bacterium]|nr:endonuclease/exonuclease/phosphatase family protein [Gemmatimonadales bacterium]
MRRPHPPRLRERLALLVLLCLAACTPALTPAEDPTALRVMTFNIRYGTADDGANSWPFRRNLVFDVIRDYRPDLLGVQEALRGQLDEIGTAVPGYTELGVGRDDGRTAGEYSAILFRHGRYEPLDSGTFWFSDTPDVPGSTSWGNRITRIATWARLRDVTTGGTFVVYNLHLDHESQPSRERSAELLATRLARHDDEPVIVMGDFNSGEANPAYRFLTGAGELSPGTVSSPRLRDTYRVAHPADTLAGTFNGFTGARGGDKIDHILVSGAWTIIDAAIVTTSAAGRFPSDHFPVTAIIRPTR